MLTIFIYAFLISFVVSVVVIYLSHKHTFFIDCHIEDKPQKFHDNPVPRAGGIGILAGLSLLVSTPFGVKLLIPTILAFISGIFEDFHNSLTPRLRLFLQLIAAICVVWVTGAVVTYLGLGITLPYWMGVIFSIFAIIGMINAINIIDGFNGLASGVVVMILLSFAFVSYAHQNQELLYVLSIALGAVLGFFVLVFPFGKIFLGDGGAYLLGLLVAVIGIFLAGRYEDVSPWYVFAIFIYPVWEVLFSIMRKLSIGLSPMCPDNYHIHMLIHRQLTKNNPLTALVILLWITPFMLYSTFHANSSKNNMTTALLFIATYLLLYWYLYRKDRIHQ